MQNPPLPDDILKLGDLTDASLLDTLQKRFAQKKIYAAAGNSILVSLNPFAWQKGLFSAEASRPYHAARALDTLPPHLFAIAEAALRGAEPHECVIVSGESGAGKTEATKLILEHFVRADALRHGGRQASAARDALHSRVLSANPVLEAFGNAKTLRNDNSSRFGKLLEVRYDGGGSRLRGVRVVNFLLERTRVSGPAAGERSFHVLYQLLAAPKAALPPPLRASLPLGRPEDAAYAARAIRRRAILRRAILFAAQFSDGPPAPSRRYLRASGCYASGRDDGADFAATVTALGRIGVGKEDASLLWSALAGVLLLGEIEFEESAEADDADASLRLFDDDAKLVAAAAALQVSPAALRDALCFRTRGAGGAPKAPPKVSSPSKENAPVDGRAAAAATANTIVCPLTAQQATDVRDALARAIYSALFEWIVARVNATLNVEASGDDFGGGRTIGLLDIYGFECFEHNSLEQLLINLANERLQRHFNQQVIEQGEGRARARPRR